MKALSYFKLTLITAIASLGVMLFTAAGTCADSRLQK